MIEIDQRGNYILGEIVNAKSSDFVPPPAILQKTTVKSNEKKEYIALSVGSV